MTISQQCLLKLHFMFQKNNDSHDKDNRCVTYRLSRQVYGPVCGRECKCGAALGKLFQVTQSDILLHLLITSTRRSHDILQQSGEL